jgi:DNA-directed RNA polymerase subunit RPC12/RpoP
MSGGNELTFTQYRCLQFITQHYKDVNFNFKNEIINKYVFNTTIDTPPAQTEQFVSDESLLLSLFELATTHTYIPAMIISPSITHCPTCSSELIMKDKSTDATVYYTNGIITTAKSFKKACAQCKHTFFYSYYKDGNSQLSYPYPNTHQQQFLHSTRCTYIEISLLKDVSSLMFVFMLGVMEGESVSITV